MKQNLHYFFSILLTIILLSPPVAAWAARNTNYLWFRNGDTSARNLYVRYSSSNKWANLFEYKRTADANWNALSTNNATVSVPAGDSIKIRVKDGVTINTLNTSTAYNYFNLTSGKWEVGGDLMTLLAIEEPACRRVKLATTNSHSLLYLFKGSTALVSAEKLKFPNRLNASCCDQMFNGCTGLVTGPADMSNIDSIPEYALNKLFYGCSKLTNMPNFPQATTIGNYACQYMFSGCKISDCSDKNLPATTIGIYAYRSMFQNCSQLTSIGSISAETIGERGCFQMFSGCSKLTNTVNINATSIGIYGLAQMYYQCTSLTSTGAINTTAVGSEAGCWQMFYECTSLESHADIKATSIGDYGCKQMFYGCSSLTSVGDIEITSSIGTQGCKHMYRSCSSLTEIPDLNLGTIGQRGCDSMFVQCSSLASIGNINATSIGVEGCRSMFENCGQLTSIGNLNVSAKTNSIGNYGCQYMFRLCKRLGDCSNVKLTAKQIGNYAYYYMFDECYGTGPTTGLTKAPKILADDLGTYACYAMFTKCSLLTTPPDTLKAEALKECSYYFMFNGCIKLERAPVICAKTMPAATGNAKGAIGKMFNLSVTGPMVYDTLEIRLNSWYPNNTTYNSSYYWTYHAPASGLFICSSSLSPLTYDGTNYSRVPSGWAIKYYPKVTFRVSKDRSGNLTEGNWGGGPADTVSISGDWYGDGPFPTATHATKDFRGWVDVDGNEVTWESAAVARANPVNTITLYPNFTSSVNFTFDVATNGATWDGEHNNDSTWASGEAAAKVAANTPVKAGYRFVKWHTDAAGTGGSDFNPLSLPLVSTTYYAIFVPLCTFDVNTNEGAWSDASTANRAWTKAELTADPTLLTEPVRTYYDFTGWNTEEDGSGDDFDPENIPDIATYYYAIFTPIPTYTVTIAKNVDGYGSVSETSITDVLRDTPISIDDNELTIDETTVTATPASTTAEYTYAFSAWKNGETVLTGNANTVTSNMTITAHFTRTANDYTLTWDFDGGTTATAAGDYTHGTVAYGTAIVAPANPTKNGYAFAGWDATPASTMPAANTTYTAQWTTIYYTFDVATNGGTWDGSDEDNKVLTVSDIAGMATPQKDKFTFERWNTLADGTGEDMDIDALPPTATKYYAIFIKVDYFRFIAQNATSIASNIVSSPTLPSLSYSTDAGVTWNTFTIGTTSVVLAAGDSILFKGTNASGLNSGCTQDNLNKERPSGSYWYFTSTDSISVAGNIMTLVQGTNPTNTIPANGCFAALMNNLKLVSAAKLVLPTTTTVGCYQYMFYRSSIRIAPELPAETVANYAYQGMFSQCSKLKIGPEIAATTVGEGSMIRMFHTCTALTKAPSELRAQTLAAHSYYSMFWGCSALHVAPVIYATTMVSGSSDDASMGIMFRQSGINNVSVRMKEWAYSNSYYATNYWLEQVASSGTFTCPSALNNTTRDTHHVPSGWTINYIPELTFDVNTNGGTWEDESTTARVLEPETTWAIPTDVTAPANRTFVGWNTEADGTGEWLIVDNQPVISTDAVIRTYYAIYAMNLTFNVATAGATWDGSANENRTYTDVQFRRGEIPSPQRGDIEVCSAWVTAGGDTLKSNSVLTPGTVYSPLFAEYVCITAQTDNVGVGISSIGTGSTITFNLYYSTDGMNWKKASGSPFKTINTGEKLYLRGTNANGINTTANGAAYGSNHYIKFNITNNATLSGNLMTLIHPTNPPTTIPGTHCFAKLFKNDTENSSRYCKITDASRLKMPATTMLESCYEGMFHDCNLLVNGPKLVATTLAVNCYKWLFYGCSALRRVEVAFDDWSDDGSGNPAYTNQWMYGTTTDPANNAMFVGPAALSLHARNIGHIQKGWKVANLVLQDNQPNYYYDCLRDTLSGYTLNSIVLKRNFWARSWVAFNVPFDFDILPSHPFYNNVYRFVGAEGDASQGFNIQFEGGVYHLDAGVPYLYYGTREDVIDPVFSTDDYYNDIVIKADAFNTAKAKYDGDDAEFNPSNSRFQGTVRLTTLTGGDNSIIFIYANRLYYPNSGGNTMRAFQGYFKVNGIPAGVAPRVRMMVDGQETGVEIEEFGADGQAAETGTKKYIQDGVMVIERNGVKYDAQGHKLN